jgi:hypothetical protein
MLCFRRLTTDCGGLPGPRHHPAEICVKAFDMTSTPATLNVADTMVQRTPRFYPELEREMFETTAHMYRNTIPTLLRVARRVHYW